MGNVPNVLLKIQRQLTGNVKHESQRDRLERLQHQVTSDE
jgi:hypothetical protein